MRMNTQIVLDLRIQVQFTSVVIQNKKPLRYSFKKTSQIFSLI